MRTVGRLVAALSVVVLLGTTACGSDEPGGGDSSTTLAATETTTGAAQETTPPDAPADGTPTSGATGGPTPSDGSPVTGGARPDPRRSGTDSEPLAGLWAGEYKSVVPANANGTFTVVFEGSPPEYTGSLVTPGLCEPDCTITATVSGSAITFGSVGPRAVTYKGTVSGSSMSGTYTVGTEGQGNGTWSAVRG